MNKRQRYTDFVLIQMQAAIARLLPGTLVWMRVRSELLVEVDVKPGPGNSELTLHFAHMAELARILRTEKLNFRHHSTRESADSGSWGDLVMLTIEAHYPAAEVTL